MYKKTFDKNKIIYCKTLKNYTINHNGDLYRLLLLYNRFILELRGNYRNDSLLISHFK